MERCLICYQDLKDTEHDYHAACVRSVFGTKQIPDFSVDKEELKKIAISLLESKESVAGVQPKVSLYLEKHTDTIRLTIVSKAGGYILKPQTEMFAELPENEHLTMLLASTMKLPVALNALVRLKDGSFAYITKRMDRTDGGDKLGMEDMAQLTGNETRFKYRLSYEKIVKAMLKYSKAPGQDKLHFFKTLLHSYLTGNADMHLKNFSLLETAIGWRLSPAYDLVNTKLAMPSDHEEFALTLNGKKSRFKREELLEYLPKEVLGLPEKVIENAMKDIQSGMTQWADLIQRSFLTTESKEMYLEIVTERAAHLGFQL